VDWRVPQVDPYIDDTELTATTDVIRRGWLTEGPHAADFLSAVRADTGARYAVLAPNGTLGLFLAFLALDLPRDSEILVPTFTFYGSVTAAIFAGLKPVFVDADPETFNVDVDLLDAVVTERTAAVMPVHIYGHSPPLDRIMEFAARRRLAVIEDAAQGYGVTYQGRHAGTWGDVGMISFFADKTITMGEGGVVLTDDGALYHRLRLLRNQGRLNSGTFVHDDLGMNFRVTDLQCAVGLAQVRKAPEIVARKQATHARYVTNLSGVPGARWLQIQQGSTLVPFRFALLSQRRERLVVELEHAGIQTRRFFCPMHQQPMLQRYAKGSFPVADSLYADGVLLPVHHAVSDCDVDEICEIVRKVHSDSIG